MTTRRSRSAFLLCSMACGRDLPHPPYTPHVTSELIEVPAPPPPPRVEEVPPRPASGAVWIDGEWSWRGRAWGWQMGYWAMPPDGATFSPWQLTRDAEGHLYLAPGTWRDPNREPTPPPPALALGGSRPQPLVGPDGENEPVGKNLLPDGGRVTPLLPDGIGAADAGPT